MIVVGRDAVWGQTAGEQLIGGYIVMWISTRDKNGQGQRRCGYKSLGIFDLSQWVRQGRKHTGVSS